MSLQKTNYLPILLSMAAVSIALIIGLAASILPWWLLFGLAALPAFLALSVKSPVFLMVSGLLTVLLIPVYKLQDLFFVAICLYGLVRMRIQGESPVAHPISWMVVIFLSIAVSSTAIGYVAHSTRLDSIYNEARVFAYWAVLFALVYVAPKESRASDIYKTIIWIGGILSVIVVFQGLTGVALAGTGRVAALDPEASDVTRVQIAGFPIIQAALLILIAELYSGKRLVLWKVASIGLLLLAIYFNFGRAVWVWTFAAIIVLGVVSGGRALLKTLAALLVSFVVVLGLKVTVNPKPLEVAVDRLTSVGQEGGYGTSYGWRKMENALAVNKIISTYGLGVGVGGDYRDFYIPLRNFPDHVRYIHQGHLGLMLKTSILGWLVVLSACIFSIAVGLKLWRKSKQLHAEILGASVCIGVFIVLNNTQPTLMSYDGVMALALLLSLIVSTHSAGNEGKNSDSC